MRDRARHLGLRGRLAIAIAAVLLLTVGATFVIIYRGTGAEVRGEIDRELQGAIGDFQLRGVPPGPAGPHAFALAVRRYLATQPFHASSRLLFATIPGAGTVTNEPELLGLAQADEPAGNRRAVEMREAQALRSAPVGFSTVGLEDAGTLRVLTTRIHGATGVAATIGVGESLRPATDAQAGVARTFALAGTLTLVVALVLAYLIAARISQPLRRMARIAARVDAGDLSPRIAAPGPRDEIRVLADAFDHMLDRLETAFGGQRAFLADTSHELRTPLTIIRGQLEVLARQRDIGADDVRRVEQLVRAEVERMQRLVDDLLLLAHADEPAFLTLREVDLTSYLAELIETFQALGDRRFECGDIPPGQLRADPDRLTQALSNIVRNAIAHTEPGGHIRLRLAATGTSVTFAVDDDGPGIPPAQRERIFERFHRPDPSRTRSSGGAGLGLAIVRAIVEAHGGKVSAGAAPGGGARISFTLPGFRPSRPPARPDGEHSRRGGDPAASPPAPAGQARARATPAP